MAVRQYFVPQHGMGSQTPAVQHAIRTAVAGLGRMTSGVRRRRKKKAAAATRRARRTGTSTRRRSGSRLIKGSAAAKRYMAKIRRMRKKK